MKKKLIAAVTSLVMVATLAPATAFASTTAVSTTATTTAAAEAVTAASVKAAIDKIETPIVYSDEVKKNLETIRANYKSLEPNAEGQGAVTNIQDLEDAEKVYKEAYTDRIVAAEDAIKAIPSSLATTDGVAIDTAAKAVLRLKNPTVVAVGKYSSDDTKDIRATAIAKASREKLAAAQAAILVVDQIEGISTITRTNYTKDADVKTVTDAKTAYDGLTATPGAQEMVGNYPFLKKQVERIAAYTAEVTDYDKAVADAITTKGVVNTVKATVSDIATAEKTVAELEALQAKLSEEQIEQIKQGTTDNLDTYKNTKIKNAKEALAAIDAINAIPATIAAKDIVTIKAAREAFDAATDKTLIDEATSKKLTAAEMQKQQLAIDTDTVKKEVLAVMNAIGAANTLTSADKAAVDNAVAVYKAWYIDGSLTPDDELSKAYEELAAKQTQVNQLAEKDDQVAAEKIVAMIEALPAVKDVKASDKDAYDKAAKAYKDATDAVKAIVDKSTLADNTNAIAKLNGVKAAVGNALKADADARIVTLIKALDSNGSLADKAKYDEIDQLLATDLSAYDENLKVALPSGDLKTYYDKTRALYEIALENAADQDGQTAAKAVIELINQIPTLKADGTDTEADIAATEAAIKAAEDAYTKLNAEGKAYVSNYNDIAAAKAKVATAKVYPLAKDVKTVYGYDTTKLTEDQVAFIEAANKVYTATNAVAADKAILEKLTTASERTAFEAAVTAAQQYRADQKAAAQALEEKVNAVKEADIAAMTLADRAKYTEIVNAYEALGEQAKADFAKTDAYAIYQKLVAKYDSFDLEKGEITVANTVYTGEAQQVAVTVKDAAGNTVAASMYKVTYRDNTDVGTATVRVKGDDVNYTGTKSATFEITAASLEDATVSGITTKTYTGKAMTQAGLKVALNGVLIGEENYTVAYKNNAKVGKASVTITGTKNCTGTITKTFVVKPGKATVTSLKAGKKKATVKIKSIPGATYKIAYKQRGNGYKYKTVKTTALSKTITGLKSGKVYKVKVLAFTKVDGKTYYTGYSTIKTVKVK